jgi:hypothetical protein
LDYNLQRLGPDPQHIASDVQAIDEVAAELAQHVLAAGGHVLVHGEYGIEAVDRVAYPNRILRAAGWLAVHASQGGELLDAGASRAFAVCDHQLAHVYVARAEDLPSVRALLEAALPGTTIYDRCEQETIGLAHPRSGELVLVAPQGEWFAYPYWLDDACAPDFARTVDIHNKPGYDPAELLIDPRRRWPAWSIARKLLARQLGFRTVFDFIPLDPSGIRGSHGRLPLTPSDAPVVLCDRSLPMGELPATGFRQLMLSLLQS